MNTTRMVIGSITVTLAIIGLAWTVARIFDAAERAWDWLVRDRVTPLLEDDDLCPCGKPMDHTEFCYDAPPPPLPPERTWEQMTSHQLPLTAIDLGLPSVQTQLGAARERRAPWWEAEHRAAYESLGFDYPSGLVARVRELAP